ncbi:hypothetical protein B0H17DRAFT_1046464 [Mycena rosella]|uniref:DUF7730 domain-containing protein n=1 Tax=Mycena rosella TaxID=1033263 RepID=A0AAD7DWP0_MYCRO|nr:hypothetical protein B0H17DRAFT_1046464 [Mycena rosella]
MIKFRVAKAIEWLLDTVLRRPRRYPEPIKQPQRSSSLYPPHLPRQRVDIRQRPLKEQSQSSHFLSLPLELRQHIYELALGGRLISLKLIISATHTHYVVRSRCYAPVSDDAPNTLDVLADAIPTALLFSCRQVYLEALPILHQCNTFHFRAHEFAGVVRAALGLYCLPDIRSVYLLRSYRRRGYNSFVSPWREALALLRQMGLRSLVFEFGVDLMDWRDLELDMPVLDGWWTRGVVKLRNLRRFEIFFSHAHESEARTYSSDVAQKLRELIIGPEADEKYRVLVKEREEARRLGRAAS